MIKKQDNPGNNAHRVITFLTRDELDFLDRISKDAMFSAGIKLSRSKIISAIVNVMRKMDIDGRGLSSKKDLENRILKTIKNLSEKFYNYNKEDKKVLKGEKKGEHHVSDL